MTTATRTKAARKSKTGSTRKSTTARKSTSRSRAQTTRKRRSKTTRKAAGKRTARVTSKSTAKPKARPKRAAAAGHKATRRSKASQMSGGTTSSISKAAFRRGAKPLEVQIQAGGKIVGEFELDPREFSSGSFGWFASEKVNALVGKERVRCQLSLNVTVIGSRNSR